MRPLSVIALVPFVAACSHVQSSAHVTGQATAPSTAPVSVSATRDPSGARELGIVEAHGRLPAATLGRVLAEFSNRTAALGGDYGRIDRLSTRFEIITQSYTYDCGTSTTSYQSQTVCHSGPSGTTTCSTHSVPVTHHVPRTCSGTRQVEVATLTVVGHAYRVAGGSP